jgi:hypothetical protein
MKCFGIDGKEYQLRLRKTSKKFKSKYHLMAHDLIKTIYPLYTVYEETKLPGCKTALYLDLFVPNVQLAIEIQGESHFKFIPHFHTNIIGYAQAIARDREKREWCEINEISLIELPYNESIEQWTQRILA